MKKFLNLICIFTLLFVFSCVKNSNEFNIYSRESESGTHTAFLNFLGLEKVNIESSVTNNTNIMLTSIESDINGIGYVSYASINSKIKVLNVNNININENNYPFTRDFYLVYKDNNNEIIKDFLNFINSKNSYEIISKHYEAVGNSDEIYVSKNLSGKIVISGSSSVYPIVEKLKEEYEKLNPSIKIELQANDSSTGIEQTLSDISDIGMSSRELKNDENDKLNKIILAKDKIAIIVNKDNKINNINVDELKKIYSN